MKSNNHYIPKMYLKRWLNDKKLLSVYRTVVANKEQLIWKEYSIKNVCSIDDFYTAIVNGKESDAIEEWFNERFEQPAVVPMEKLINGNQLTKNDWYSIIDFASSLLIRTPKFIRFIVSRAKDFIEAMPPTALKDCRNQTNQNNQNIWDFLSSNNSPIDTVDIDARLPINKDECMPIKVVNINYRTAEVGVVFPINKRIYQFFLKESLNIFIRLFRSYRWSVLFADEDSIFITSDAPISEFKQQDDSLITGFENGILSPGVQIFLPISPKLAIYTMPGRKLDSRIQLSKEQVLTLNEVTAKNAERYIISNIQLSNIQDLRPRAENKDIFEKLENEWKLFHNEYIEQEKILKNKEVRIIR